jgi:hypothetical protein
MTSRKTPGDMPGLLIAKQPNGSAWSLLGGGRIQSGARFIVFF